MKLKEEETILKIRTPGIFEPDSNVTDEELQEFLDNQYDTDLVEYINEDKKELKNIIKSIKKPKVMYCDGSSADLLWEIECFNKPINKQKNLVLDYLMGQLSDGWGEGVEQESVKTETVDNDCSECGGSGEMDNPDYNDEGDDEDNELEPSKIDCEECNGSGTIEEDEDIYFHPYKYWISKKPEILN